MILFTYLSSVTCVVWLFIHTYLPILSTAFSRLMVAGRWERSILPASSTKPYLIIFTYISCSNVNYVNTCCNEEEPFTSVLFYNVSWFILPH